MKQLLKRALDRHASPAQVDALVHCWHRRAFRAQRRRVDGERSLASMEQLGCLFVHVPRTGGVSVARSLFGGLGGGHRTVRQLRRIYGPWRFPRLFRFAFVRDPYDRLVSAYHFLRGGGFDAEDARWAQEVLAGYPSFAEFVLGWLTPETARSKLHFVPQSRFLCAEEGGPLEVDFVGRFEFLAEDFQRVCERLGVERELQRSNAARRPREVEWTPELRARVGEVYAEDFRLLGYPR